MKIFITGIAGFLGSHLADRMIELGHDVVGNDTLIGGYLHNVPEKAEFFQIDCCDMTVMSKAMEGCDVVIHLAALIAIPYSYHSPETYVDTNVNKYFHYKFLLLNYQYYKLFHYFQKMILH